MTAHRIESLTQPTPQERIRAAILGMPSCLRALSKENDPRVLTTLTTSFNAALSHLSKNPLEKIFDPASVKAIGDNAIRALQEGSQAIIEGAAEFSSKLGDTARETLEENLLTLTLGDIRSIYEQRNAPAKESTRVAVA